MEDESLVAMQLEDMLEDLGCEVVGFAMRVPKAIEMLDRLADVDVAILDVNIAGEKIYPVARVLKRRGVPIVFATGYGRGGMLEEWHSYPVLQKPYTSEQVAEMMCAALTAPLLKSA